MTIRFSKFTVLALAAILGGAAALATNIGLVIGGASRSTSTLAQAIPPASTASRQAPASAPPETMKIVPAEVIESNPQDFIGTGDQSAGYWTRP
ncbi:hypothetical protein [Rhodoblastus sp.]|jgi:hypothetical protein|uniref:hypothetical protein n=1 Tax=Rhodoblastus sp. TaxID=1962975 RepID=UPI0025F77ADA|nr:hypothetical protein [Rhodoblastus sp.]